MKLTTALFNIHVFFTIVTLILFIFKSMKLAKVAKYYILLNRKFKKRRPSLSQTLIYFFNNSPSQISPHMLYVD